MTATQLKRKFEGWFAASFWVDMHYALAAVGTVVVFAVFAFSARFDVGFAAFVSGMWVTAVGNDRLNMPSVTS